MNFLDYVGEKILDCVLAVLGRQLGHLIHYKSNVDNLKAQVEALGEARDGVQRAVDTAIRSLMKINPDVQRRLTESDDIVAVARIILEDDRPAKMTYCNGWCPNLISRYQVSKRADKTALEAKNLKDEILKIDGNSVGYHDPTRGVETLTLTSNEGYEAFESRNKTITEVLEALKDPNITRIGIHGMGGVGKTMLVKEVLKQAEKDKLFDKYLFLVVSNDPDLKRIQGEFAEQLGPHNFAEEFLKKTEQARRDQLSERLKLENRVLIILDDIWKYLDLRRLGISFGDDQRVCKLLLTSRLLSILQDMGTQKQLPVEDLTDNEPISLFEKIVGDLAGEFKSITPQIVKECAGLPLAITTVANALKNRKNIAVWEYALNQLKMSRQIKIVGTDEQVYRSIKLSYDFLPDEEKSLLLLCSLHGEDYDIMIEDLLKYAVGWDLLKDDHKIKHARSTVHKLVEGLKDSCLLLGGKYNGTVKMHDVIRDVVINIAAEERHMFTIRTVDELHTRSKRKDAVAISLPYINGDLDLPNHFECSKLELLLLFVQKKSFRIPDSFFEGLKDLKVLKLSVSWSEVDFCIPSSLSSLENLQTLCLDGDVQNAIIIGELKNLKALSLSLSDTERLPKEIGQLTHLQLLDLRECSELKFIPPNVLSNLKRLEELYLPDDVEWEVEVQSTEKINAMVSELDHLSHLTKLHMCIKNAKILPKDMVFERLESYRIAIGSAWLRNETSETSRILKLSISFQSDDGYKVLFKTCETLILDKMKGVKNNLCELDFFKYFQSLKHLTVQHNDEIQYIFKSIGVLDYVFLSLESITLRNVNNLEWICYPRLPRKTFCNLRVVEVTNCCKLEFVFSSSMSRYFSHLQEIHIEDCEIMSAIVAIEREEEIEVHSDDNIMFGNLHSLKLRNLFKLKGFLSVVDSLVLLNGKVVFPNLEELEIEGMDSMKMIWPNQLISDSFGKLHTVYIEGFSNLKSVFPTSVAKALMQLGQLTIMDCATVEEIVAKEEGIETTTLFLFPQLTTLKLQNLPELKSFYLGNHTLEWPSLKDLYIQKCHIPKIFGSNKSSVEETDGLGHHARLILQPLFFIEKLVFPNLEIFGIKDMDSVKMIWPNQLISDSFGKLHTVYIESFLNLKSVFPTSVAKALMQLGQLTVIDCATVEEIVAKEEGIETTTLFLFPQLTTLRLQKLPELKSFYRGNHISKWPSLNRLGITSCDKLKIFGSTKSSHQETNGLAHHANLIQQPLFFIEKDKFPNLEYLELDEGDAMNETCGGPSEEFCCNLKELTLYGNGEIPNVEAPRAGISDFRRLKNIVPFSSTSFHYLRRLEVFRSDVLISLLTPSTARTLVQLQYISIRNCERMTEIVANEGSEAEAGDEIAFNNLIHLTLGDLPSLTAFHLGNRTIKFPSLIIGSVSRCPKLKIFCSGVLSTPKLGMFWMQDKWMIFNEERDGDVDLLNARIKEYWAEETDASEGGESEHDTNDDLEREATSEVGDTQCDGE